MLRRLAQRGLEGVEIAHCGFTQTAQLMGGEYFLEILPQPTTIQGCHNLGRGGIGSVGAYHQAVAPGQLFKGLGNVLYHSDSRPIHHGAQVSRDGMHQGIAPIEN